LTTFQFPAETRQLRIDTGFREGDTITPFYDPMIAKIIVVGENRDQAIEKMAIALEKTKVSGISTNLEFLKNILSNTDFQSANINTNFIDIHRQFLINS
jgi:3-methylcrotonyl-CoA carboxylase alpha subunit